MSHDAVPKGMHDHQFEISSNQQDMAKFNLMDCRYLQHQREF